MSGAMSFDESRTLSSMLNETHALHRIAARPQNWFITALNAQNGSGQWLLTSSELGEKPSTMYTRLLNKSLIDKKYTIRNCAERGVGPPSRWYVTMMNAASLSSSSLGPGLWE